MTWIGPELMHNKFKWEVNNGDLALFWEDIWFEDQPLLTRFQKLFHLSKLKNQVVRNFVDLWCCYDHLSDVFRSRELRPWEIDELDKLDSIISPIRLNAREDILVWISSGKKFSTKDGMEVWRSNFSQEKWKWKFIWSLKVPPNIKMFLWKVHFDILPTRAFLKKRIGCNFDDSLCLICKSA